MNVRARAMMIAVVLLLCSANCRQLRDDAEARASRAARGSGDIVVGVAWPGAEATDGGTANDASEVHFLHGVEVAEKRIAAEGGVLGRKVRLVRLDEGSSIARAKAAAQRVTEDLDVVAVIGHRDSDVAMVTSVMYEYENVVMIAAGSSSSGLLRDGFSRVFRTLPGEEEVGRHLADFASDHGQRSVLVVFENDVHGRTIANAFEARAEDHRLSIVDRLAFDRGSLRAFEQGLRELRDAKVEAVVLAARLPEAKALVTALRRQGVTAPILGGDGLDSTELLGVAEAEGTIIASVFGSDLDAPETKTFVEAYRREKGHEPDTWAAQGYDALMLVAHAITAANSASPSAIADALRRPEGFALSTGRVKLDRRGAVIERRVIFRRIHDGKFELVAK